MPEVTCGDARAVLEAVSAGRPVPASDAWKVLFERRAIAGAPDAASLTDIGRHVLGELALRAYRCDGWPLDRLAEHEALVLGDLDATAHAAEYFLSDLGPVVPDTALPFLRVVSTGLANRRESPEELAERFRNVWGMLEVMQGDPRDRLLAVELLMASGASMSQIYSPMVVTVEALRAAGAVRAVGAAAVLHLEGPGASSDPVARWKAARQMVPSDEAAALLATVLDQPAQKAAFDAFRARFDREADIGGKISAAIYLASQGDRPDGLVDRVLETARRLKGRNLRPLLTAALLASEHPLAAGELIDWVDKASDLAARRQLAVDPAELHALGIALVEGLPRTLFSTEGAPAGPPPGPLGEASTLLAMHAWIYRPILDPQFERAAAQPIRGVATSG